MQQANIFNLIMAAQIITILKIAGLAGKRVQEKIQQFKSRQKKPKAPNIIIATEQWPPSCRRSIDLFAETLRHHSHEAPVIFCAEYVDMWSVGSPVLLPTWEKKAIQILGDQYDVGCYRLPDKGALETEIKRVSRQKMIQEGNSQEYRWMLAFLQVALQAWSPIITDASLIWLRRPLGPSVDDEQIMESLGKSPAWLK